MLTIHQAEQSCGTLSNPGKMPGRSTSISAELCHTGSKLRTVPGSVCENCYALTGRYRMPNVRTALDNRYRLLVAARDNPEPWITGMVTLLQHQKHFRWLDSGDIQGPWHYRLICEVARRTPHVAHWLPSREYHWITDEEPPPDNLCVRLSGHMVDGPPPAGFGFPTSTVVSDAGAATCPAQYQGHRCGDCRQCWDKTVQNVSYPKT